MNVTAITFLLVAAAMGYDAVVDHNLSAWLLCAFCAYAGLDLLWHEITTWRLRRAADQPVLEKCQGYAAVEGGRHDPMGQCGSCQRFAHDCGFPGDGDAWIERPPYVVVQQLGECPFYRADETVGLCAVSKQGWKCKRHAGHANACAMVPVGLNRLRWMWRLKTCNVG